VDKKLQQIICTAFSNGKKHDFRLFKESNIKIHPTISVLTDSGYQGLQILHGKTQMPKKRSKKNPLTEEDKKNNRQLSSDRVLNENVIGCLKRFRHALFFPTQFLSQCSDYVQGLIPQLTQHPPLLGNLAIHFVFAPASILHMMQRVFDLPVASDPAQELFRRQLPPTSRGDVIPYLFYHKLLSMVDVLPNASDLLEPREFRQLSYQHRP